MIEPKEYLERLSNCQTFKDNSNYHKAFFEQALKEETSDEFKTLLEFCIGEENRILEHQDHIMSSINLIYVRKAAGYDTAIIKE